MPRFIHDKFKTSVPCAHCAGAGEINVEAEGHFSYGENFVLEGTTDLRTGQELKLTDEQRTMIEEKGDSRFPMVQRELIEHQRACATEIQNQL